MSQRKGPAEGGPLGLPHETYDAYTRMSFFAAGAAEFLNESWKRPKRHNKRIERAALWHTILLDQDCGEALEPAREVLLLLPPPTDVETRYELQAGIRTVHATLPFSVTERYALQREELEIGNTHFDDNDAIRESALFERWHEWLWMDRHEVPQTSTEALGASAMLAEGCARISHILPKILG